MDMNPLFSYCKRNSIIHRIPAALKLVLLLAISISIHITPIWVCIVLMFFLFLCALASRCGLGSFFRDLRPILYYCAMILVFDLISYFVFGGRFEGSATIETGVGNGVGSGVGSGVGPIRIESIYLILRLLCAIEASSVFFRTTSIHQIRDVLQTVELALTFGHSKLVVSTTLSLFLGFLPQIFATYSALDLAYHARGGRPGFVKVVKLLPRLIVMSIKKANTTYLALLNRG